MSLPTETGPEMQCMASPSSPPIQILSSFLTSCQPSSMMSTLAGVPQARRDSSPLMIPGPLTSV